MLVETKCLPLVTSIQSGTTQNKVKMPKAAMCPVLLRPECWCEPTACYILTDSIFQCKCGLEKSSEPSLGKMAPKAPCRGTRTHRLSALLSKNRHKFSARRHKRHFTRGATTSSLLFISLCNNFILRLQGGFSPLPPAVLRAVRILPQRTH